MTDPPRTFTHTAHLLRVLGDTLHAAATVLEAGDERRASALLRAVHEAVKAGEPARNWETLVQLLEPHAARLQEPARPDSEAPEAQGSQDQQGGGQAPHLEFSPWGRVLKRYRVMPGVTYVTTERHGGYHLTPEINSRIPAEVRQVDGFYEQDVQGALCAYFVPFDSADRADVLVMIETRYPEIYARIVRGDL
ncbi:DUF7007 domain-containing protein [Deinococcus enclensis]|uniref:DUF7007 domain-containing protein n=1 Tax=Deinococcus enclensis TaxID=1049582 RepID=A0ABT9MHV8_9DEIO|nr:hypothetical protein [Deinococcus enclensis]MDP9766167.1 hypothetical protein [Deinococcus enclensis]